VTKVAVVGAGISGLTTAFHLIEHAQRAGRGLELTVIEADAHAGGNARTLHDSGFVVETGPNGFLARPGETQALDLVRALGLESRLQEARPASRRRFVLHGGRLHRAPDSPVTLLSTRALSPGGKLRLMMEPWARRAEPGAEETVFDFACRRVGREAAERLVDAAVSGISAGDSRRLSAPAAFPLMIEMEREHGSLVRAMIARRKLGVSRLLTLEGGVQTLVDALATRLGTSLRTGSPVRAIGRIAAGWRVALAGGGLVEADQVVLATQAHRAAELLAAHDPSLAELLSAIPFAGLAMVALAYREADTGPLPGYGYLVARAEQMATMGVVWESSLFEGRAPHGTTLVRAMLGGVRRPDIAERTESELVEIARSEIAQGMGVNAAPIKTWVRRFPSAIAQFEIGHAARVAAARARADTHPGLTLCGTSYDRASFAGAVEAGLTAARRVGFLIEHDAPALATGAGV
jgi:oxygen-dependent protoporphyrinogen oxidase